MKHLITIMAVFLLMGCQTTNSTPNAVVEPAPQNTSEKQEDKQEDKDLIEPNNLLSTMKPVMCADQESVHKGLKTQGEEPLVFWKVTRCRGFVPSETCQSRDRSGGAQQDDAIVAEIMQCMKILVPTNGRCWVVIQKVERRHVEYSRMHVVFRACGRAGAGSTLIRTFSFTQ